MFQSVPHLLFQTIQQYPEKIALRYKRQGQMTEYTYQQFGDSIKNLVNGLAHKGIKPGDKIAILSNNRPEWTMCDFAGFCLRGIVIPIYQTLPPNQIAYILNDSQARAIFVEDQSQFDKITQIKDQVSSLEFILSFENIIDAAGKVETVEQLLEHGKTFQQQHPNYFEKSMNSIQPKDICSIVYTSGTTGEPKGVMLHHFGFLTDIINAESVLNLLPDDVFLSFLPLSHLYERLAGHWCPIYRGATIHYAQGIDTVINDIAEARPTVMVSVPRLYEKIATAVMDKVEQGSFLKKKIFYWALSTGLKYHQQKNHGSTSKWLESKYHIADKLVFNKIKQKLGGRFRYPIAGGAPLSVETLKFFEALGLPIIEGYGMTETHLIITLTPPGETRYGSCGKPIPGIRVNIGEDGEVLIAGDTVMAGYYNKPELTSEIIDADGWLHTGDIGNLDENNFLFLTDRKKNIIVTSGGKNIASAPIENLLKKSRYIDDVCLLGDKRKFVSAIIVPNYENLKRWSEEHKLKFIDDKEMVANANVEKLIASELEILQKDLARFEKVKKFILLPHPLSIEQGELTPSLKIKRNVVEKRYKEQIDRLYQTEA